MSIRRDGSYVRSQRLLEIAKHYYCWECGKMMPDSEEPNLDKAEATAHHCWIVTSGGWLQLLGDPDKIRKIDDADWSYLCPECLRLFIKDMEAPIP